MIDKPIILLEHNDYQKTIKINVVPQKLFEAVTQRISEWWSKDFEGSASSTDKLFTVRFGRTFKTMTVTRVVTNKTVEWLCTDQLIEMPEGMAPLSNPREWVGNKIVWEIRESEEGSILNFRHIGLTPQVECWSVCEPGWDQTLQSLFLLLTTGKGRPFEKLDAEHLSKARELYNNK